MAELLANPTNPYKLPLAKSTISTPTLSADSPLFTNPYNGSSASSQLLSAGEKTALPSTTTSKTATKPPVSPTPTIDSAKAKAVIPPAPAPSAPTPPAATKEVDITKPPLVNSDPSNPGTTIYYKDGSSTFIPSAHKDVTPAVTPAPGPENTPANVNNSQNGNVNATSLSADEQTKINNDIQQQIDAATAASKVRTQQIQEQGQSNVKASKIGLAKLGTLGNTVSGGLLGSGSGIQGSIDAQTKKAVDEEAANLASTIASIQSKGKLAASTRLDELNKVNQQNFSNLNTVAQQQESQRQFNASNQYITAGSGNIFDTKTGTWQSSPVPADIKALQSKFPDANITSTDTPDIVKMKLNSSAMYQKATQSTSDKTLQTKYPDAGIVDSDTQQQIQDKLKNSPLYQKAILSTATAGTELKPGQDLELQGMLAYYSKTGQVPAFGNSATNPMKNAFWKAVGQLENGGTDIVSNAILNKNAVSSAGKALSTQQNQLSATKTSLGTLDDQLNLALDYSNKVDRSGSPVWNKYLLYLKGQYAGDANTQAYQNIIATASAEFAKILSGAAASISGVTVSSAEEAKNLLNAQMSPAQLKEVISAMRKEGKYRVDNQQKTIDGLKKDIGNIGKDQNNNGSSQSQNSFIQSKGLTEDDGSPSTYESLVKDYGQDGADKMLQQLGFTKVGGDTNTAVLRKAVVKPDGNSGGQCGRFVNQITGIGMGDSYQSKLDKTDPSITYPEPGMVFVMPYNKYGHTGIIVSVNNDGTATVKDSNFALDEKIQTHNIPISKMTGFAKV